MKNANWKPSYDFRVQTNAKDGTQKLKLVYFGRIQQKTGEDWKDAEIILSTGQPKHAGSLPKMSQLNAKFKPRVFPMKGGVAHVQQSLFGAVPPGVPAGPQKPSVGALFGSPASQTTGLFGGVGGHQQEQQQPQGFGFGTAVQEAQVERPPTPPPVKFEVSLEGDRVIGGQW